MLLSMCSVLAWAGGRAGILTDSRQLCQPIRGKLRLCQPMTGCVWEHATSWTTESDIFKKVWSLTCLPPQTWSLWNSWFLPQTLWLLKCQIYLLRSLAPSVCFSPNTGAVHSALWARQPLNLYFCTTNSVFSAKKSVFMFLSVIFMSKSCLHEKSPVIF